MNEHQEQVRFSSWLTVKGIKHTAIPNGMLIGKDRGAAMAKMKWLEQEGFQKGVPDMLLLVPHKGGKVTVFIEMKREDLKPKLNGKGGVKPEQQEWLDALDECEMTGAYTAWGCAHAQEIVNNIINT